MTVYKLFKGFNLPEDNQVAMELLERVANIWDDNAGISPGLHLNGKAPLCHQNIPHKVKEALIYFSTSYPHQLEEYLNGEPSVTDICNDILSYIAGS